MFSTKRKAEITFQMLLMCSAVLGQALQAADPAGSGPEPAIAYSEQSLPTHTIYRPANLRESYPVVLSTAISHTGSFLPRSRLTASSF
jgi:hypothetical protein